MVAHGAFEVGVKSIKELVNKLFCATETGGFADLVVVMCQRGVAESNVLAYLQILDMDMLLDCAKVRLTDRGKCVKF